jgi:threonine aldolase
LARRIADLPAASRLEEHGRRYCAMALRFRALFSARYLLPTQNVDAGFPSFNGAPPNGRDGGARMSFAAGLFASHAARRDDAERIPAMNFASDNAAGIAPSVLDAIVHANRGFALGYGNDDLTRSVERRLSEIFERDVAVFLVPTGTAANALALAHVSPPWGAVLCHAEAHIVTDECGAPEFFGDGLKLIEMPGEGCKISAPVLKGMLERYFGHRPHQVIPAALSLTQASEAGTIYRIEEIAELSGIAHRRGLAVHVDGARFANALVRLNATAAQATWQAGVDVLSFGATKGGALAAEAIVFFDPARAEAMPERRKRGGHLLSKHRFLSAQFLGFLADDAWLTLARHANAMADRLAAGLAAAGFAPVWPVEANIVFVALPKKIDARLRAAGATYYVRHSGSLPSHVSIGPDEMLVRLVTSFATDTAEIDRFVELCRGA